MADVTDGAAPEAKMCLAYVPYQMLLKIRIWDILVGVTTYIILDMSHIYIYIYIPYT